VYTTDEHDVDTHRLSGVLCIDRLIIILYTVGMVVAMAKVAQAFLFLWLFISTFSLSGDTLFAAWRSHYTFPVYHPSPSIHALSSSSSSAFLGTYSSVKAVPEQHSIKLSTGTHYCCL
jgi:hypothetical protein